MKKVQTGQLVEWNTILDGKITRLRGKVTDYTDSMAIVVALEKINGYLYKDLVDIENLNPLTPQKSEQ